MKKMLITALGFFVLAMAGCSSTPKTTDQLASDSRGQYIQDVRDSLQKWDDRASKMSGDRAADLRASISDTRAELRAMESAPSDNWQPYRSRINNRLDRIQDIYNMAR